MSIIVPLAADAPSYAWLCAEIAAWLHRTDLTDRIPSFIKLIEADMSEKLDSNAMETTVTLTTVPGEAALDLPADIKTMTRVGIPGHAPLKYAGPEQIAADYPSDQSGQPLLYTVIGTDIELRPVPDAAYSIALTYERRIPALSDANVSNWLLNRSPNAYLFGALTMAQPFINNDARIATYAAMYADAINSINLTDWHSGASMRVRAG
jgi:hypothetical protein